MTKKTTRKRPWQSKYTDDMPEKFLDCRKQGKSIVQAASTLGVSRRTLEKWAKDESKPEFMQAYEIGFDAYQTYFENIVDQIIVDPEHKCTSARKDLLLQKLKSQFSKDWTEHKRTELTIHDETSNLSDDELKERIQKMVKAQLGLKPDLKVVNTKDDNE